jgi:hypothetical protein
MVDLGYGRGLEWSGTPKDAKTDKSPKAERGAAERILKAERENTKGEK